MAEPVQVHLEDNDARELSEWVSLWCDLLLARMSLHEVGELPYEPGTVFTRRALWEQAVIAYARCFRRGQRRKLQFSEVDQLGGDWRDVHDEIVRWSDKHVAHRVDTSLEQARTAIVFTPDTPDEIGVTTYVATSAGPVEEETVRRFEELVTELGERVWLTRMFPLATRIIEAHTSHRPAEERWEKVTAQYLRQQVLFRVDVSAWSFRVVPDPTLWHPDYKPET